MVRYSQEIAQDGSDSLRRRLLIVHLRFYAAVFLVFFFSSYFLRRYCTYTVYVRRRVCESAMIQLPFFLSGRNELINSVYMYV